MGSSDKNLNGHFECSAFQSWQQTGRRVEEMHTIIEECVPQLTQHLKQLDALQGILSSNNEIRDRLINPATRAGQVETKVIMPIIYTVCFMLVAIIVWFTGVEPNLPTRSSGFQQRIGQ